MMTSQQISPYWNWFYRYISAMNHPISIKFGVRTRKFWFQERSLDKVSKFCKFKMADCRHMENRFLAISQGSIVQLTQKLVWRTESRSDTGNVTKIWNFTNSSDFNEILADANFGSKNGHMTKYQHFANSKWRTSTILKIVLATCIFQRLIVRLTQNSVRRSSTTLTRDQNTKFHKFKMMDDRHFENGFIAISWSRIIRFRWHPPFRLAASVSWCWSWEKEEQLKWSLAFRLYIGSFPCAQLPGPVHTARLGRVFFCVISLGCALCVHLCCFDLFMCPYPFMFPWAVESSPLQFLALAYLTNLNEPPRALATSTITWVRS